MRRVLKKLVWGFLFLPLASPAQGSPMLQEDLKREFLGKTLQFKTGQGSTGKVRYARNGTVKLWSHNFAPRTDAGSWRFRGNKVCVTWKKVRNGREACFSATRLAKHRYNTSLGTVFWRR